MEIVNNLFYASASNTVTAEPIGIQYHAGGYLASEDKPIDHVTAEKLKSYIGGFAFPAEAISSVYFLGFHLRSRRYNRANMVSVIVVIEPSLDGEQQAILTYAPLQLIRQSIALNKVGPNGQLLFDDFVFVKNGRYAPPYLTTTQSFEYQQCLEQEAEDLRVPLKPSYLVPGTVYDMKNGQFGLYIGKGTYSNKTKHVLLKGRNIQSLEYSIGRTISNRMSPRDTIVTASPKCMKKSDNQLESLDLQSLQSSVPAAHIWVRSEAAYRNIYYESFE